MATAAALMTTDPTVIRADASLAQAANEMRIGFIHHLPVVDSHGVLVGLISQRDLLAAPSDLTRAVRDIMQTDIKTARAETPAHEVALLMLRHAIGCVPVLDPGGEVIGIVTDTDFVRVAYELLGGTVPADQIEEEERAADKL